MIIGCQILRLALCFSFNQFNIRGKIFCISFWLFYVVAGLISSFAAWNFHSIKSMFYPIINKHYCGQLCIAGLHWAILVFDAPEKLPNTPIKLLRHLRLLSSGLLLSGPLFTGLLLSALLLSRLLSSGLLLSKLLFSWLLLSGLLSSGLLSSGLLSSGLLLSELLLSILLSSDLLLSELLLP